MLKLIQQGWFRARLAYVLDEVTGMVTVGQYPAVTGPDLAAAFGAHLSTTVAFDHARELRPEAARHQPPRTTGRWLTDIGL